MSDALGTSHTRVADGLLRTIASLGPRLHDTLDRGTMDTLFALVSEGLRASSLSATIIQRSDDSALRIVAATLWTPHAPESAHLLEAHLEAHMVGCTMPLAWPFTAVVERSEVVVLDDATALFDICFSHLEAPQRSAASALLAGARLILAPLPASSQTLGALMVWGDQTCLTSADAPAVTALAAQIGIALDSAQLYRDVQAERAKLSAIVDSMVEMVATSNAEGRITSFNPALQRFYARDADPTIPPQDIAEAYAMLTPDRQPLPTAERPLERALRSDGPVKRIDVVIRRADGEERETVWSASPLRDEDGALLGAVAVGRDVTVERLIERQNRKALDVLLEVARIVTDSALVSSARLLLPAVAQAIIGLDAADYSHTMLIDDDAVVEPLALFGAPDEAVSLWKREITGKTVPPGSPMADALAVLREHKTLFQEFDHGSPVISPEPAHTLHVRAGISAPIFVDDQLIGLITLGRHRPPVLDTGEYFAPWDEALLDGVARLTGEALSRGALTERLHRAEMERLAAAEAMRQHDEFLAIASHELKTPLTSLKAYAQVAGRRGRRTLDANRDGSATLPATVEMLLDTLSRIDSASGRLQVLVDDLLDVVRIQSGKLQLRRARTDLNELCRESAEEQRQLTERKVIVELPEQAVTVVADRERILQVLVNLLSNALKYSLPPAPVILRLTADRDEARIEVRDAGPGIPPEELPHLFERFHRVPGIEVQSGSGVGLGIGLYISREIVERHGGHIWVRSVPGDGSTFGFSLPLTAPAVEAAP